MFAQAPELIDAPRLADYLGVTPQALSNMRAAGTGPRYLKLGRNVRYRWSDVEAWLDENTHQSTDEHTDQPGTHNAKQPA